MFIKVKNVISGKEKISSVFLITISAIYITLIDNNHFWTSLFSVIDLNDWRMYVFLVACFSFIFTVCFIFFVMFGIGSFLKPFIAFVIILSSITAFYTNNLGIIFDKDMIRNVVETDFHEAFELFNMDVVWHVFIYGLLPSFLLFRFSIKRRHFIQEAKHRFVAVFIVLSISTLVIYTSYKDFSFVFRENREISFLVNPVFPIRSLYQFSRNKIRTSNQVYSEVFKDAHKVNSRVGVDQSNNPKNILILVVGETARDQSFHIDGYMKNTTPELEKRNVIHFNNTWSCGTATAISLPCMFSDLKHDNFDNGEASSRQNLMDALDISGINVLWRDNNSGCKGVCKRIETQGFTDIYMEDFCDDKGCFDEALLNHLDQYISNLKDDSVIVLHTQGSHGPAYYRRYPDAFDKFKPACRRSSVQNCTDVEVKNAYDNTILYTDYFLSRTIDFLSSNPETHSSAMIYVSDHGESLGEDGMYLHGLPYMIATDYQKHVPFIMWFSEDFSKNKNLDTSCLIAKENNKYTHDNYIHSVLGLMDVDAKLYDSKLDVFDSCRLKTMRSDRYMTRAY